MNRLQGKTVLVAGAGGSQGRVIVAKALEEGANVVAGDARADVLAEALAPLGEEGKLLRVDLDVVDESSWAKAVAAAEERFGAMHGLVDAAAVLNRNGVETTTVAAFRRVLDVNTLGSWLGLKYAVPALRRAKGGSLVLIASIDGIIGRGTAAAYHASKGAVRLLARTAAVELGPEAIRVNTVCPGPMADKMALNADETPGQPPVGMARVTPLGRYGAAEDIAWAVAYLLSDESAFVTGTDLVVDGGYTAQ